ncbi:hypothetical protein NP493_979g00022 [Ridgeia piscesae]|uniref:DUF4062 domain-containing protein n=1 Tax=Ridgeia piscesae TaxID=27915 RepID=A0AAD9KJC3_RIDPI|nr:hypothetical protein NP493_979g00022 [Ridgeia piscesae]
MGCGTSQVSYVQISSKDPKFVSVIEAWEQAQSTIEKSQRRLFGEPQKKLVIRRTGWKTIRIFVSSTFKDFHQEREILVKKVFPNLRTWCEPRRLYLVECDLRWGVPKDYSEEFTLRTCLGEIDRCREDNVMPFFLNMTRCVSPDMSN